MIANNGLCPVTVNDAVISAGAGDYAISGKPVVPIPVQPGHQLGEGDFRAVFGPLAIDRDVLGNIDCQRRLAHARPSGQDHQLRVVQPAGEIIVIEESGFQTAVGVLPLHAGVDAGQRFVQHVANRLYLRVALSIQDAKHALFGAGQHLAGLDRGLIRLLDDVGAGVN